MKEFDLGRLQEKRPSRFIYWPRTELHARRFSFLLDSLPDDNIAPEILIRGMRLLADHKEYPDLLVKIQTEALKKLLLRPEIRPVYSHLLQFELDESEWVQIVAYVFAGPMIYTVGTKQTDIKEQEKERVAATKKLYASVAQQAHDLMYSLGKVPREGYGSLEPLNEYLKTSNVELLLAELRMLTTSCTFPRLEWEHWSGHRDELTLEDMDVVWEETPDLFDRKKPGKKTLFAPPDIEVPEGYYKSNKNTPYNDYLREALFRLDRVSHDFGRSFAKAEGKETTKQASIWLKAEHWRAITGLLFPKLNNGDPASGSDPFSTEAIGSAIGRYKQASEYWGEIENY